MRDNDLFRAVYRRLYESFGPQGWWPGETPLEVIVGAILTQNTAWTNVEKAIAGLKEAGALASLEALAGTGERRLARLIRPAGYYNVKARRLLHCADFLLRRFGPRLRVPRTVPTAILRRELLAVHGIGPETCDSILLYAFGRPSFVVDAYTKRILVRHGILRGTEEYHAVQALFMRSLPRSVRTYNEYHALIVRLAKEYCRTVARCGQCPLRQARYFMHPARPESA